MPPNWQNRTLFHGDNLTFLRAMNSETVDLIATDPPFNKGRDFHATPDSLAAGARFQDRWSWEDDVHPDWVDKITDDFPHVMNVIQGSRSSYGDDMGAFLCFMGVRLLEMRRVLKPTGSIYLHCDPTASHYLKELMDAVFGRGNFRNEIVWCYRTGGASRRKFARKHDAILFYTKSNNYKFDLPLDKSYLTGQLRHSTKNETFTDEWGEYQNILFSSTIIKLYRDELGYFTLAGCRDYWNLDAVGRTSQERTGYPTQKPLPLYERIIKASSNPGDVVLDPFSGCATTCVAAERLGRQWVGMDIWDKAHETVIQRLQKEGLAADGDSAGMLPFGEIYYATEPPLRTDDGEEAAPFLRVKERIREPEGQKMSRAEMYDFLLTQHGMKCQGCDRVFDDPRYLELDHNTPRSDGGLNHISNRILLCSPCNRAKSNTYTLSGLRRLNRQQGWMAR